MFKKICSFFVIFFAACFYLNAQIKFNPVVDVSVYGGKYYLDGDSSSIDMKMDAYISPSLLVGDSDEFYPVYMGYYNGTQDVQELAGGGVLTRQRQEHTISLKYVKTSEFNKIKPRISYSKSLVKETKDEKWGDGLFDYNTFSAGIEFEQERPYGTFSESYDFFTVKYPNYASLISVAETAIDTTTYSEIAANSGDNVLDNHSHRAAFSYTWFPSKMVMKISSDILYRTYLDQPIVSKSGAFKSEKRSDISFGADFRIERPSKNKNLSFDVSFSRLFSNQNSYDASRTRYIGDAYAYYEISAGPRIDFFMKNKASFGYALTLKELYYIGRLAQDSSGNYKDSKISQEFWLNSFYIRYPVGKNFYARANYAHQSVSSNNKYEAGYRYNYGSSNWLAGVQWEF